MKRNRDYNEESVRNEFNEESRGGGNIVDGEMSGSERTSQPDQNEGASEEGDNRGEDPDGDCEKQCGYDEQIAELNDKYLRLAAEFDNYRRRTLRERQELILTAGEEIIVGILPILDDLDRAIAMLKESAKENRTAIEGTELIRGKLFSFLTSKGVKVIEPVGKALDTDLHEAIAQIPAASKSMRGKIVDVVQQGYTLNGKVIRYAKVVVGQ
jgi:Molecular chaperone GrpE (heat shock protein)